MWWMFNSLLLNYVLITSLVCGVHTLLILSPPQLAGFVDVSFYVTL